MDIELQVATLMQGAEYGDKSLKQAMTNELRERLILAEKEGRNLKVYCGYDPTKPDLHLGHTVTMRKLRQFQDLGHEVIFLIGNFTSLVGDPSDKDKLRPILTPEQVEENAQTYTEQAFRVLIKDKTTVLYNAEWLSKLTFADLINLASNFTLQQFITRDNFRKRWDNGDPVFLHETFYAIMQAYDAYHMKADVQVGGTDQLFNIVTAGRKLMTALGEKPNIGITMSILPGTDGEIRMSKSMGNHIPISTDGKDMYGKIMSLPDTAMPIYAKLCTRWTSDEVAQFEKEISSESIHPRDAKMKLALEIVSVFYPEVEAIAGQEAFVSQFQKGKVPDDMPEFKLEGEKPILDILVDTELVSSRSDGRRMLKQKAVKLDGEVLPEDPFVEFIGEGVLQVGKRRFVKIVK